MADPRPGYAMTGAIVVSLIALTAIAWRVGLDPVLSFWIVYVLTRPLGASIGDHLAQPSRLGGFGLGARVTSLIFTAAIIVTVTYLAVSKVDLTPDAVAENANTATADDQARRGGLLQTTSRSSGTTRRPASSRGTRRRGRSSTTRSTPCSASCGPQPEPRDGEGRAHRAAHALG